MFYLIPDLVLNPLIFATFKKQYITENENNYFNETNLTSLYNGA